MTDKLELRRLAEARKAEGFHLVHNMPCDDLIALLEDLEVCKADNEKLRKQVEDMSPFKGARLTGPDHKCLACGGYHYGMSGLPCPKMGLTAYGGQDG